MRRVDVDCGCYFRFQGSAPPILKGFATIIRVTPRISHQRGSSLGYILLNLRSGENPDTGSRNFSKNLKNHGF